MDIDRFYLDNIRKHKVLSPKGEQQIGKRIFDSSVRIVDEIAQERGFKYYEKYLRYREYLRQRRNKTDSNEGDKIIQENGKTKVEYLFEMYPLSDIHRVVKSIAEDYSFISNHPSSFFNGNHPNIEERTQDRNTSSVERAKRIEKFYSENRESINELTLHNTRLLAIIANSFHDVHMEFMDRFQYGFFGLQRAAEGFDHRKGYKFSTYASKIIRRSIFDALEDNSQMIGIPIEKELLIIKMNYTRGLLKSSLQREPTRDEITKSMGLNNQELKELEDLSQFIDPIHDSLNQFGDYLIFDHIKCSSLNPREEYSLKERDKVILGMVSKLHEKERRVVKSRFGVDGDEFKTLQEIGIRENLSREQIRRIESNALKKLKTPEIKHALEELL